MFELKLNFLKDFSEVPPKSHRTKTSRRKPSFISYKPLNPSHKHSNSAIESQNYSELLKCQRKSSTPRSIPTIRQVMRNCSESRPKLDVDSLNTKRTNSGCDLNKRVFRSPMKTEKRLRIAIKKVNHYNSKKWMEKHNSRNNDEGYLMNFASDFFKVLDTKARSKISGKVLLEHLLALGIATDSLVLKETLSMIFECKDIENVDISLQDFLSMFRPEVVTDIILKQLNESALQNRKKQKILNELHQKLKLVGQKRFSIFTPAVHSIAITSQPDPKKLDEKMITINEHLVVVEGLWKKFFNSCDEGISLITTCEIFKFFKIFQDNFEAKKYIVGTLGQVSFVGFRDFQQLFAKSMIKGAFVNLSKRLFEGNYAEKEMSPGFKISAYQRALLMSGVKCPNSNISIEEGQMIVTALEKFQGIKQDSADKLRNVQTKSSL
jgi:hypothetical protein